MERKIKDDPDFIHSPKNQNSLQKFLAKAENPADNKAVGRLLLLSEEQVEEIYQESVAELKKGMCKDDEREDI